LIDDLIHFDFREFDEEFRDQMKEEVPELLNLATTLQHDLEGKDVTKEMKLFHQRVKERE
jgi:hypothetical protein